MKLWYLPAIFSCLIGLLTLNSCQEKAVTLYVSPRGSDSNSGTLEQPYASFYRAQQEVEQILAEKRSNDITVYFRDGYYFFDQTAVLDNPVYGNNSKVTFAAYGGEKPVFGSGILLQEWSEQVNRNSLLPQVAAGKVWETDVPEQDTGMTARFLATSDGRLANAVSGRFFTTEPDSLGKNKTDFMGANYDNSAPYQEIQLPPHLIREWENPGDVEIVSRPHYGWVLNILPVEKTDLTKGTVYTTIPATYFNYKLGGSGDDANPNVWIQNSLEHLDEPGEWIVNSKSGKIFYWPESGKPQDVYYPLLKELIQVKGNKAEDSPAGNIHFRGITFTFCDRDTWNLDDMGLQHDWAIFDKGDALVRFTDTENCSVTGCRFENSGGGGIRLDLYSQNNRVENSLFRNLGGTAILIAGYGPGNKDLNGNNAIVNNEIHDIGQSYFHSPAIFIWQSGYNRIASNLVYNLPYSGIVVSGPRPPFFNRSLGNRREITGTVNYDGLEYGADQTWDSQPYVHGWDSLFPYLFARENVVELNDVHHVMNELDDGNAIYLSGTGTGNRIHANYVHHNTSGHRQGAIRADDFCKGNSFTENIVYRYAMYGIDTKYSNEVVNNYIIDYVPTFKENGEKHYQISFFYVSACGPLDDCVGKKNIHYQSEGPSQAFLQANLSRMILQTLDKVPELSDCDIDSNLYYDSARAKYGAEELERYRSKGVDSNSIAANPMFLGLEESGFALDPNSPAFKIGIKQIDFDKIGLRKTEKE